MKDSLITVMGSKDAATEAYKELRTLIQYRGKMHKVILITGPHHKSGKTTLCGNLAVTLAQKNKKVLMIDCDLRKPALGTLFEYPGREGLTNLVRRYHLDNQLDWSKWISKMPGFSGLYLLSAGQRDEMPLEILDSDEFKRLLSMWRDGYDYILLDSPSINEYSDALVLAGEADGVIMTVEQGKTTDQMLLKALEALDSVSAELLGAVLVKVKPGKKTRLA